MFGKWKVVWSWLGQKIVFQTIELEVICLGTSYKQCKNSRKTICKVQPIWSVRTAETEYLKVYACSIQRKMWKQCKCKNSKIKISFCVNIKIRILQGDSHMHETSIIQQGISCMQWISSKPRIFWIVSFRQSKDLWQYTFFFIRTQLVRT